MGESADQPAQMTDWGSVQTLLAQRRYAEALELAEPKQDKAQERTINTVGLLAILQGSRALESTGDISLLRLRVVAEDPILGDAETASYVRQLLDLPAGDRRDCAEG